MKILVKIGPTSKYCPSYWSNFIAHCRRQARQELYLAGLKPTVIDLYRFNETVRHITIPQELAKYHGKFTNDDLKLFDNELQNYAVLEFDSESAYTLFVLKWSE